METLPATIVSSNSVMFKDVWVASGAGSLAPFHRRCVWECSRFSHARAFTPGRGGGWPPAFHIAGCGRASRLGTPFLSGLTDADVAFVQTRTEQHLAPEVVKARDATLKAMQEVEAGWQRAPDLIGQRAGLTKGPDGSWSEPTDATNAAA
jgi:hypothetical protein